MRVQALHASCLGPLMLSSCRKEVRHTGYCARRTAAENSWDVSWAVGGGRRDMLPVAWKSTHY